MCAMVCLASWHAEQAATMGDLTSVVFCALHGAARLQVATVATQGCAVVQVQGVVESQFEVTAPIFWVTGAATLLTVYGPLVVMLHGLAVVHTHGAAGVQAVAPWVPL